MQFGLRWFARTHVPTRKQRITFSCMVIGRIFAARITAEFNSSENTTNERFSFGHIVRSLPRHVAAERSSVMTCLELALTAQLICVSGQTIVCTDNSSIAQLLGVSACTITERSRSNDDYRRIQVQRDKPLR